MSSPRIVMSHPSAGDELISEEDQTIDFAFVYALHTFAATLEGQASVMRSEKLQLLDDSNAYWWLIRSTRTLEIGYIPAEIIELPYEKLARLNVMQNIYIEPDPGETPTNYVITEAEHSLIDADNEKRRKIQFKERVDVQFFEPDTSSSDEEDELEDSDEIVAEAAESPQASSPAEPETPIQIEYSPMQMSSTGNTSPNIFSSSSIERKQSNETEKNKSDFKFSFKKVLSKIKISGASAEKSSKPSPVSTSSGATSEDNDASAEDLSGQTIIRIYAGNVDLKANYKAVAISPETRVPELIERALKKFRVPIESSDYYLSVLHLDSAEKKLKDDDNIFEVLESLSLKSPKSANHSKRKSDKEDSFLKVLINKKMNAFDHNYHLIRIWMDDEYGHQVYKTIGVSMIATVEEVIPQAARKFKLREDEKLKLFVMINNTEIELSPQQAIMETINLGIGSNQEIAFILKRDDKTSPSPNETLFSPKNVNESLENSSQRFRPRTNSELDLEYIASLTKRRISVDDGSKPNFDSLSFPGRPSVDQKAKTEHSISINSGARPPAFVQQLTIQPPVISKPSAIPSRDKSFNNRSPVHSATPSPQTSPRQSRSRGSPTVATPDQVQKEVADSFNYMEQYIEEMISGGDESKLNDLETKMNQNKERRSSLLENATKRLSNLPPGATKPTIPLETGHAAQAIERLNSSDKMLNLIEQELNNLLENANQIYNSS